MGPYPPRVVLALRTRPSQSAIGRWGWGFHTVRGGTDPGDLRFLSQGCGDCRYRDGFTYRGWESILPGCRCLRASPSQSATTHWRWCFYTEQSGSDPGIPPSFPGCRMYRRISNQGWDPILPGWRWLYAGSMHEPVALGLSEYLYAWRRMPHGETPLGTRRRAVRQRRDE